MKSRRSKAKCPICGRPMDLFYRPFCSRRCADVDLSRWLSGGYVIPGPAEAEAEDEDRQTGKPGPGDPERH